MKFKSDDILYYVDPFIFTMEKLKMDMAVKENKNLYYIESKGAYLKEENLFRNLNDAKRDAFNKLNKFWNDKRQEIIRSNPKLEGEI